MRAGNEARVGIVVVTALVLLIGGYFALRGIGLGAQSYYMRLDGAALIAEGNDVRLQGVRVGLVQSVTLDPATQQPILTLAIRRNDPPYSLYRSYDYTVRSSGIIGEYYVHIEGIPQTGDIAYPPNDPSQVILAEAGTSLMDVSERADAIAGDVRKTLQNLNITLDRINKGVLSYDNQIKLATALEGVAKLTTQAGKSFGPGGVRVGFGDPQTQRALNATFINAALAANEAGLAAREVRRVAAGAGGVLDQTGGVMREAGGLVADNRVQIQRLLVSLDRTTSNAADTLESVNFILSNSNLQDTSREISGSLTRAARNVEDATESLKILGDEQTQEDVRATITALRESTEALRDTTAGVKGFFGDAENQGQVRETLATLGTTATTLAETTANLRDATAGLKNILGDENVQSDFKAIPSELRATLEATRSSAERINNLLGGRSRRNTDPQRAGLRGGSIMDGFDFTYRHLPDGDKKNFGDIRFQSEFFGGPFRVGLDEIGEDTSFTLQTGRFFGENAAIRYGLYRSKLGVGADWRQGRFSLEGNLYDPNERSWNVYGGVRLSPQLEVLLGREKRGDVNTNAIGLRLRP